MTTEGAGGGASSSYARPELSANERRVLGVLIEKALTTPEYYPLTTKALVAGCNQKSNREPVMVLSDEDVEEALGELRGKRLVIAVRTDSGYATRWRHELDRTLTHQPAEQAILGELLLRGPQTEGELRTRASRMRDFRDLLAVQETLGPLAARDEPLVVRLSPEGASRGVRHAHALYPAAELAALLAEGSHAREHVPLAMPTRHPDGVPGAGGPKAPADRVARLEARVARLEAFLSAELGVSFDGSDADATTVSRP